MTYEHYIDLNNVLHVMRRGKKNPRNIPVIDHNQYGFIRVHTTYVPPRTVGWDAD